MADAYQLTKHFKGDRLSVMMFGSSAAAIRAAARTPIEEALDYAKTRGKQVFFPAGDYQVDNSSGALTINAFAGHIIFDTGARLVFSDVSQPGFLLTSADEVRIDNMRVKWSTTPTIRTTDDHAIEIRNSNRVTLINPRVENGPAFGVLFLDSTYSGVIGGYVSDNKSDGFHWRDCVRCFGSDLTAYNTGDDSFSVTGDTTASAQIVLTNLRSKSSAKRGIAVVGPSDVVVSGFTVEDSAAQGIVVLTDSSSGALVPRRVKISNGVLRSCGSVSEAGSHAIVVSEDTTYGGIECTLRDIDIFEPYFGGVYVPGSASNKDIKVVLDGVRVHTPGTGESGMKFENCYPTLKDCRVYGGDHYGMYFDACPLVLFNDLEFHNVGSTATSFNRTLFTVDCVRVYGHGIHVIDDRNPAVGYAVGDYESSVIAEHGRVSGIKFSLPYGTPQITRNVGHRFIWEMSNTGPVYFRDNNDTNTPLYLMQGESGAIVTRDATVGYDAFWHSLHVGANQMTLFGGANQAAGTSKTVTGATNATPIVITAVGHGITTGWMVTVASVGGNTAANGEWRATVLTADTLELDDSVGNGAYTTGGTLIKQECKLTLGNGTIYQHGLSIKDIPNFTISDAGEVLTVNGAGDGLEFQVPDTGAAADGWYTMTIGGGAVTPDLDNGVMQTVTATADFNINAPIKTSGAIASGDRLKVRVLQDATGGRVPTWNATYKLGSNLVDDTASIMSVFEFVYNGSSWECHSGMSGITL